jgi:hypothetical protein
VSQRWSSSWNKCVQISLVLECNCVPYCVKCLHMQKVTVDIICHNLLHLPEYKLLWSSDDKSVLKWWLAECWLELSWKENPISTKGIGI